MINVLGYIRVSTINQVKEGKRGRKKKAKLGGYSGGGAPYGYKAVRGSKVLEVVPRVNSRCKTRASHPKDTV